MKIFYYGADLRPGTHIGRAGELRIHNLDGLWSRVQAAIAAGEHLAIAREPILGYLDMAIHGDSRPECLLCSRPFEGASRPLSMVVLVLPYRPRLDPVMVSALCGPCCQAEPDDARLLLKVETELQQGEILAQGLDEAPLSLTRQ
jgi:hypothetical protein